MAKVKDFKSKFNARKETEKPKKVSKFSSFTENEAVEAVEEKAEISRQIKEFKSYYELIQRGDYYRLISPFTPEESLFCAWETVKPDGSEALVCTVRYETDACTAPEYVKVKGLCPDKMYRINGSEKTYLGAALMNIGLFLEYDFFTYPSRLYHITLA